MLLTRKKTPITEPFYENENRVEMEEGFLKKFTHQITLQEVISAETTRWSKKLTF